MFVVWGLKKMERVNELEKQKSNCSKQYEMKWDPLVVGLIQRHETK